MKNFKYLFLIFYFFYTTPSIAQDNILCGNQKRIFSLDFIRIYKTQVKKLKYINKKEPSLSLFDVFLRLDEKTRKKLEKGSVNELCLWNRFIFIDFTYYFGLWEEWNYSGHDKNIFLNKFLNTRDKFYDDWLSSLQYKENQDFSEWGHKKDKLENLSLNDFIEMGSDQFGLYEWVSSFFNSVPRKNSKKKKKQAKRFVYDLVRPKSPFNSIMTEKAYSLIKDLEIRQATACMSQYIDEKNCQENIWDIALYCNSDNKQKALAILGVLASQRMTLLRDLKAWMEYNLPLGEYLYFFETLKSSSSLHFKINTFGEKCGGKQLIPRTIQTNHSLSTKPYHFWSVAFISQSLTAKGFAKEIVLKESVALANKYKSFIRLPGLYFNMRLGRPLKDGTVGDYKDVLKEQELGANWGFELFHK